METLKHSTETKAIKEHSCNFCTEKIEKGETYLKSTHKYEGEVYDWKVHKHCNALAERLKMYDDADEGVTCEFFQETIHYVYDDLSSPNEELQKQSDNHQQLRYIKFKDKLEWVMQYYKEFDKDIEIKSF